MHKFFVVYTICTVGLKHLDDCPIQPKIPIYLLVGGCFGLLKLLSLLLNQVIMISTQRAQTTKI